MLRRYSLTFSLIKIKLSFSLWWRELERASERIAKMERKVESEEKTRETRRYKVICNDANEWGTRGRITCGGGVLRDPKWSVWFIFLRCRPSLAWMNECGTFLGKKKRKYLNVRVGVLEYSWHFLWCCWTSM